MAAILAHPSIKPLLSDDHFSVAGPLVKAWASSKSFRPRDSKSPPHDDDPGGPPPPQTDETFAATDQPRQTETQPMLDTPGQTRNAEVSFRGGKRSNASHASVTDPDARLCKKAPGAAAMLCITGHTLMENRNGLVVQAELTHDDGQGERNAALEMLNRHSPGSTRHLTLGADKGYDSADFVAAPRGMVVTPHVAQDRPGIPPSSIGPLSIPATRYSNGAERRSRNPLGEPEPSAPWPRKFTAASTGSAPNSR